MRYQEAMDEAAAGYPVRRMNWRPGWQVRKEGSRLVYATTAERAKAMHWSPTQLDRDAPDWVHVTPKPKAKAPAKRKGKK